MKYTNINTKTHFVVSNGWNEFGIDANNVLIQKIVHVTHSALHKQGIVDQNQTQQFYVHRVMPMANNNILVMVVNEGKSIPIILSVAEVNESNPDLLSDSKSEAQPEDVYAAENSVYGVILRTRSSLLRDEQPETVSQRYADELQEDIQKTRTAVDESPLMEEEAKKEWREYLSDAEVQSKQVDTAALSVEIEQQQENLKQTKIEELYAQFTNAVEDYKKAVVSDIRGRQSSSPHLSVGTEKTREIEEIKKMSEVLSTLADQAYEYITGPKQKPKDMLRLVDKYNSIFKGVKQIVRDRNNEVNGKVALVKVEDKNFQKLGLQELYEIAHRAKEGASPTLLHRAVKTNAAVPAVVKRKVSEGPVNDFKEFLKINIAVLSKAYFATEISERSGQKFDEEASFQHVSSVEEKLKENVSSSWKDNQDKTDELFRENFSKFYYTVVSVQRALYRPQVATAFDLAVSEKQNELVSADKDARDILFETFKSYLSFDVDRKYFRDVVEDQFDELYYNYRPGLEALQRVQQRIDTINQNDLKVVRQRQREESTRAGVRAEIRVLSEEMAKLDGQIKALELQKKPIDEMLFPLRSSSENIGEDEKTKLRSKKESLSQQIADLYEKRNPIDDNLREKHQQYDEMSSSSDDEELPYINPMSDEVVKQLRDELKEVEEDLHAMLATPSNIKSNDVNVFEVVSGSEVLQKKSSETFESQRDQLIDIGHITAERALEYTLHRAEGSSNAPLYVAARNVLEKTREIKNAPQPETNSMAKRYGIILDNDDDLLTESLRSARKVYLNPRERTPRASLEDAATKVQRRANQLPGAPSKLWKGLGIGLMVLGALTSPALIGIPIAYLGKKVYNKGKRQGISQTYTDLAGELRQTAAQAREANIVLEKAAAEKGKKESPEIIRRETDEQQAKEAEARRRAAAESDDSDEESTRLLPRAMYNGGSSVYSERQRRDGGMSRSPSNSSTSSAGSDRSSSRGSNSSSPDEPKGSPKGGFGRR